jgi:hypothetical protein
MSLPVWFNGWLLGSSRILHKSVVDGRVSVNRPARAEGSFVAKVAGSTRNSQWTAGCLIPNTTITLGVAITPIVLKVSIWSNLSLRMGIVKLGTEHLLAATKAENTFQNHPHLSLQVKGLEYSAPGH